MSLTNADENYSKIIERAWEDSSFKQQLLENPIEAMTSLLGKAPKVPEGYRVVVTDQTDPKVININIPSNQQFDNLELSDEQLEALSGGDGSAGYLVYYWYNVLFK